MALHVPLDGSQSAGVGEATQSQSRERQSREDQESKNPKDEDDNDVFVTSNDMMGLIGSEQFVRLSSLSQSNECGSDRCGQITRLCYLSMRILMEKSPNIQ